MNKKGGLSWTMITLIIAIIAVLILVAFMFRGRDTAELIPNINASIINDQITNINDYSIKTESNVNNKEILLNIIDFFNCKTCLLM